MTAPGYWMHETGGELRKAMQAYLLGEPLSARQINLIRAYLRQWIAAPGWAPGPGLDELRARIDGLNQYRRDPSLA